MGEDTNAAATTTADGTQKRKESTPPDGYVCRLCSTPGHWIQVCPTKKTGDKKRKRDNPDHVYQEGKDPSPEDIEKAKQMQAIPPPKCFCGVPSRLNMVKRSKAGGDASRAIGKYFFFCSKKRDDETQCRFARPVEMELNKKKKIDSRMSKKKSGGDEDGGGKKKDKKGGDVDKSKHVCKFFAKTGSCKKGIKCEFSHAVGGDTSKSKAPLKAWEKKKVVEMKGDKDDESSSSSDDSGGAKKGGADAQKNDDSGSDSNDDSSSSDDSD